MATGMDAGHGFSDPQPKVYVYTHLEVCSLFRVQIGAAAIVRTVVARKGFTVLNARHVARCRLLVGKIVRDTGNFIFVLYVIYI